MSQPAVFWTGPRPGTLHEELLERLEAHGLVVLDIESAEELLEALRLHPKAVIVACDRGDAPSSQRVLDSLEAGLRSSPVVVLVEQSGFGDYYDVMKQGASFYYEQNESPRRIAQAVCWAANMRAA